MAIKAHLEYPANDAESRQHPRRALFLETSGRVPDGSEADVTVHNMSVAGMLLETDAEISEGETLAIDLPQAGIIAASVVWRSGDLYGCAFAEALSEAALAAAALRGTVVGAANPILPISHSNAAPIAYPASPRAADKYQQAEPFGMRLNRLRRERALTLADVAAALGVSKPTVWAWEKGKAKPIPERLEAIAGALGVSPDELRVSGVPGDGPALVEECRLRIATAYGTEPQSVRIMIEV